MEVDSSRGVTPEQDPAPATERNEHQSSERYNLFSWVLFNFSLCFVSDVVVSFELWLN